MKLNVIDYLLGIVQVNRRFTACLADKLRSRVGIEEKCRNRNPLACHGPQLARYVDQHTQVRCGRIESLKMIDVSRDSFGQKLPEHFIKLMFDLVWAARQVELPPA